MILPSLGSLMEPRVHQALILVEADYLLPPLILQSSGGSCSPGLHQNFLITAVARLQVVDLACQAVLVALAHSSLLPWHGLRAHHRLRPQSLAPELCWVLDVKLQVILWNQRNLQ